MATTAVTNTLNSLERTQLRNAEAVIQKHVGTFIEVGNALAEIRDKRLYRETHKSFDAYVSAKWDIKRNYANKLIQAAEIVKDIEESKSGYNCTLQDHLTESQVRPLAEVPKEDRAKVWQAAIEKAKEEEKPLTAALIKEVVEELQTSESSSTTNGETPDVAASVLLAKNTDKINPTPEQLEKLAAMPEKQQNAIMRAVDRGKTLAEAIKAANKPPEKAATSADEAKTQIKIWADTIGRWLGQSPSIDELRGKFPGKQGDAVVGHATALFESLKNWQKAIK